MLTKTLVATAALSMLVGGGSALAQSRSSTTAGPKQPIPYSKLDAYMKASPKARASKDWWAGSTTAPTGMSADTSATAPEILGSSSMSPPMTPSTSTDTSVNPPTTTGAPTMPSTPPTYGGTEPNGSTLPNPATPGDMSSATTAPPMQPK